MIGYLQEGIIISSSVLKIFECIVLFSRSLVCLIKPDEIFDVLR